MKLSVLLVGTLCLASCEKPEVVTYEAEIEEEKEASPEEVKKFKLEDLYTISESKTPETVPKLETETTSAMAKVIALTTTPPALPPPTPSSKYQTAKPVPGKPGYVINPFTGGEVDARGVPPESLIRDPNDPNHNNKFRIPSDE